VRSQAPLGKDRPLTRKQTSPAGEVLFAISFLAGGKGKERRMTEGHDDSGVLADDHPHVQLYRDVTPIWHDGESPDEDLDWRYSCGFSTGFVRGIVMAVMKPEWAVGWYRRVRQYYLTHNHPPEDLQSWERCAEETARAIPVEMHD